MQVLVVVVAENQLSAECAACTDENGRQVLFVKASTPLLAALEAWEGFHPTGLSRVVRLVA